MSDKKVLVVFGATGVQGGSVVNSILADPATAATFTIRAVTRDTTKDTAQALQRRGAEVVAANMDDKESLRKALKGAYAVFSLTNYWDHMDPERETTQGINVADVAAELGVEHLIYSSLRNITEISNGRYTCVPHFNSKAKVESYIRDKLPNLPSTFFLAGCYMTNFSGPFSGVMFPYDPATNSYTFTLPIPHTAACIPIFEAYHDTGKFVKAILTKRDQTLGKRVLGATKYASAQELADEFERVRGIKASAVFVPTDQWKLKAWEPAREEMAQSMEMMGTTGYYGHESLDWSLSILDEPATTWEEFIRAEKGWSDLAK